MPNTKCHMRIGSAAEGACVLVPPDPACVSFSEFNESGPISSATILVGLAAVLLLFVPDAAYLFECLTLLASTTLVVLILFGGKLLPCFTVEKPLSFEVDHCPSTTAHRSLPSTARSSPHDITRG